MTVCVTITTMEIHEKLKAKRKKLKISIDEAGFHTRIDPSYYSKIERGVAKPTSANIKSMTE